MVNQIELSHEYREKLRHIVIKAQRIVGSISQGNARSARKGMGLDFKGLRDYTVGDDLRFIDWKASARSQAIFVKEFFQEQSLTIFIIIDMSSSMFLGTHITKYELAAGLAMAIGLIAVAQKDYFGLILYSDAVDCVISPGKGQKHLDCIISAITNINYNSKKQTNSSVLLGVLLSFCIKNGVIFHISDGYDTTLIKTMGRIVRNYKIYAIYCIDPSERAFPDEFYMRVEDVELGVSAYVVPQFNAAMRLSKQQTDMVAALQMVGCCCLKVSSLDEGVVGLINTIGQYSI